MMINDYGLAENEVKLLEASLSQARESGMAYGEIQNKGYIGGKQALSVTHVKAYAFYYVNKASRSVMTVGFCLEMVHLHLGRPHLGIYPRRESVLDTLEKMAVHNCSLSLALRALGNCSELVDEDIKAKLNGTPLIISNQT